MRCNWFCRTASVPPLPCSRTNLSNQIPPAPSLHQPPLFLAYKSNQCEYAPFSVVRKHSFLLEQTQGPAKFWWPKMQHSWNILTRFSAVMFSSHPSVCHSPIAPVSSAPVRLWRPGPQWRNGTKQPKPPPSRLDLIARCLCTSSPHPRCLKAPAGLQDVTNVLFRCQGCLVGSHISRLPISLCSSTTD